MKSCVKRRIDEMGRIVIPANFREELELKPNDRMEVYLDGNKVILKKPANRRPVKSQLAAIIDSVEETVSGDEKLVLLQHLRAACELMKD